MQKEELIQKYYANRLTAKEKLQVEHLLQTDAEFQELFETHAAVASAFRQSKQEEIKKQLQALEAESERNTSRHFFKKYFGKFAVAAVLAIGLFIAVNSMRWDENYFETYFETYPNTYLPITRSASESTVRMEAFKAYENENYAKAETLLFEILKTDKNPTIRFYYAMSLLNQEKFEAAFSQLEALQTISFEYATETRWYLALLQLKNQNFEAAKAHLKEVQQLNKDFKTHQIREILEKL